MIKKYVFDDLPFVEEIELELFYSYGCKAGKYNDLPENCYEDEEESRVYPPLNWEEIVMTKYRLAGQEAIKEIADRIQIMEEYHFPRTWAEGRYYVSFI